MTIIDFLPRCLGPLPDSAADYCSEYMTGGGVKRLGEWGEWGVVSVPKARGC